MGLCGISDYEDPAGLRVFPSLHLFRCRAGAAVPLISRLYDRVAFVQDYLEIADDLAVATGLILRPRDDASLFLAHQKWRIERAALTARLSPSPSEDGGPLAEQDKELSHLKEMAALLPCLARSRALYFGDQNTSIAELVAHDPDIPRRRDLFKSVPDAYMSWLYCFSIVKSYEDKRKGRSGAFAPSIPPTLLDEIVRGLHGDNIDALAAFYLLKAICARDPA